MATEQELLAKLQRMNMNAQQMSTIMDLLAKQSSRFSTEIRTTADVLKQLNNPLNRELTSYADSVSKMVMWRKKESEETIELLKDLKKQQLLRLQRSEVQKTEISNLKAAVSSTKNEVKAKKAELEQSIKTSGYLSDSTQKIASELDALKVKFSEQSKSTRGLVKSHRDNTSEMNDINTAMKGHEAQLKSFSPKAAFTNASGSIITAVDSFVKKVFDPAKFGKGITDMVDSLHAEINTGMNIRLSSYNDIAKLGLKPAEFAQQMSQYRRAAMAAGGLNDSMTILAKGQDEYADTIADPKSRTEFLFGQMDNLAKAGIKPTLENTVLLKGSFESLRKNAGMTSNQFTAMVSDITNDESTIQALRATSSEAERQMILKNITARVSENVAMGMSKDQALAAAKALNKIAGQGPLDRFKQAAKMRAYGGAMGISGTEEAAQAVILGQRASKAQQDALQKWSSEASNQLSQSAMGPMGAEIFATTLATKLGLDAMIGPKSDFNTVLTKDLVKSIDVSGKTFGEVDKTLKDLNALLTELNSQVLNNPLVTLALGAVGGALASMGLQASVKMIPSLVAKLTTKASTLSTEAAAASKGAAATAEALAKTGPQAAAAVSTASKFARILPGLGTAATIGLGVYEGASTYSDYEQGKITAKERNTKYGAAAGGVGGALGGAALGAAAGTFILPGIGTILGGAVGGIAGALGGQEVGALVGNKTGNNKYVDVTQDGRDSDVKDESEKQERNISMQMKKMDQTNDFLKIVAENTTKQLTYTETLISMTALTEKERGDEKIRNRLRSDSRFTSAYTYV